jgi:hypothetical protein
VNPLGFRSRERVVNPSTRLRSRLPVVALRRLKLSGLMFRIDEILFHCAVLVESLNAIFDANRAGGDEDDIWTNAQAGA